MKNKITIGLDIDGVLANNNGSLCAYLNTKYPNNRFTEEEIDNWDYIFNGVHQGKTVKLPIGKYIHEFWDTTGMIEFLPVYFGVESGIKNTVRSLGKDVNFIFITSRPEKYKDQTVKWIEENIVPIIGKMVEVYFVRDKSKPPADVLIDDNLNNLKTFVKSREDRLGILMERPWNNLTKNDIKEVDGRIMATQGFQFVPTILKMKLINR